MCNFYMMYSYSSALSDDPLGNQHYCTGGANDPHFALYPPDGRSLLPKDEEAELHAHSSSVQFGKRMFYSNSIMTIWSISHSGDGFEIYVS